MHVVFSGFLKDMRDLVFFGRHLFQAVQLGTKLLACEVSRIQV